MEFTRHEKMIVGVNLLIVLFFSTFFLLDKNYEFIIYIFVLLALMTLIIISHKKFRYSAAVLWALTVWSFLHLVGGGLTYVEGEVFYKLIIVPIIGEPYNILKYDQVLHFYGFWVATLVVYYVLKPSLRDNLEGKSAILFIVAMASLGLGGLNEIVEFAATVSVPDTNVGGYENTAIDLVADFLGALGAVIYIGCFKLKRS